jgi:hypothetical protein
MSDADKIPWNHSVAVAATEYIDEPNNDSISWNKANPNKEKRENVFIPDTDKPPWNNPTTVDPTDWINGLSTNGVSQNGNGFDREQNCREEQRDSSQRRRLQR